MTSEAIQLDTHATTHIVNWLDIPEIESSEIESSWPDPTIMMDRAAVASAISLELRRRTWRRR